MNIDVVALRKVVLSHDVEIIGAALGEIVSLIDKNPFSERIRFLLGNQNLAKKPVKNVVGEISPPNCLGTAFFIAGVSPFNYPYHGYDFELNPHMKQPGPRKWDDCFSFGHFDRRVPGAFVFSYSVENDGWHAGIYLGIVGDEHVLFAQHGHGESFGPESLINYASPDYYIPKTLLKKQ